MMAKTPGSALTGEDEEPGPLQSIVGGVRNVGSAIDDTLLRDPESRSALLQIGLGLMQPQAMGQSTIGHIGQAVGGGGEAVGRLAKQELEEAKVEDKLSIADAKMRIAQQNADSLERARQNRTLGGLTEALKYRMSRDVETDIRREEERTDKELAQDAKDKYEEVNDITADPKSPEVAKYKGKTKSEIKQMMKSEKAPAAQAPAAAAPAAGGAKPRTIKQGGFTYTLQPDGTYQ